MDKLAIAAVEQFVHAGYPLDAAAILLCESDGTEEEVADEIETRLAGDARERRDRDPPVARRSRAAQVLVRAQEPRSPPSAASCPTTTAWTAPFRASNWARCSTGIAELSKEFGLSCPNVFHAGDGNLHPLIMFDANEGDQLQRAEAFGARILELCIEVGGTITGEHGVGIEKINQMCVQFRPGELTAFHAVKPRSTSTAC